MLSHLLRSTWRLSQLQSGEQGLRALLAEAKLSPRLAIALLKGSVVYSIYLGRNRIAEGPYERLSRRTAEELTLSRDKLLFDSGSNSID